MLLNHEMVSQGPVLVVNRILFNRGKVLSGYRFKGEVYCKPRILFINNKNNHEDSKTNFYLIKQTFKLQLLWLCT
jgi:hypothetical protein